MYDQPPIELEYSPNMDRKQLNEERKPVFWFKRENGETFCVEETAAWEMIKGRIKVNKGVMMFTYLGMSSGATYFEGLKQMPQIFKEKGKEAATKYLKELEAQELALADKTKLPLNQDMMGDPKAISDTGNISL